ncbi:hypothetical protein ACWA5Z_07240 [Testudinibacter sp. P80/BLE/0925]|uniref:hypothetical protein n=1 Tax=Testudinibacter sp. TW-1 TaxID=3417757 RepID=UPI003D364FF4
MNYRILFVISLIIIAVGFGGLFLIGDQQPVVLEQNQSAVQPVAEAKKEKTITVALATTALEAGRILRKSDYSLREITVNADDEEMLQQLKTDVLSLFKADQPLSLEGFLLTENIEAGSRLNTDILISPNDSRFFFESLDNGQVAYRVYIGNGHQFLLESLHAGNTATLYLQHINYQFSRENKDNRRVDEVVKNLEILTVERFQAESAVEKEYAGYVTLKMDTSDLLKIFRLPPGARLLPIPQEKSNTPINNRGIFIRTLRG